MLIIVAKCLSIIAVGCLTFGCLFAVFHSIRLLIRRARWIRTGVLADLSLSEKRLRNLAFVMGVIAIIFGWLGFSEEGQAPIVVIHPEVLVWLALVLFMAGNWLLLKNSKIMTLLSRQLSFSVRWPQLSERVRWLLAWGLIMTAFCFLYIFATTALNRSP